MPAEQLIQFWQEHYEEQSKMHTHTEFGIPNSKSEEICYDTIILETWSEVKVNSDPKIVLDTVIQRCNHTSKFWIPISNNVGDMLRT